MPGTKWQQFEINGQTGEKKKAGGIFSASREEQVVIAY
jgi:hypothetical protein